MVDPAICRRCSDGSSTEVSGREVASSMRYFGSTNKFLVMATCSVALLLAGSAASAGESRQISRSWTVASDVGWADEHRMLPDGSVDNLDNPNAEAGKTPAGRTVKEDGNIESSGGVGAGTADAKKMKGLHGGSSQEAAFTPLLATAESRSLSSTRGVADSASVRLLDAEASTEPAVVPLPASVWAGLGVLLMMVWLGRHGKRRVRLPV